MRPLHQSVPNIETKEQRLKVFKNNSRRLANETSEGSFVIFEAEHEKSLFNSHCGKEMGLPNDIRLAELSGNEQKRLLTL